MSQKTTLILGFFDLIVRQVSSWETGDKIIYTSLRMYDIYCLTKYCLNSLEGICQTIRYPMINYLI